VLLKGNLLASSTIISPESASRFLLVAIAYAIFKTTNNNNLDSRDKCNCIQFSLPLNAKLLIGNSENSFHTILQNKLPHQSYHPLAVLHGLIGYLVVYHCYIRIGRNIFSIPALASICGGKYKLPPAVVYA